MNLNLQQAPRRDFHTRFRPVHIPALIFIPLLLAVSIPSYALTQLGLGAGVSPWAGSLDVAVPVIAPSLWIETDLIPNSHQELEYLRLIPSKDSPLTRLDKWTLWIERKISIQALAREWRLSAGIGAGYLLRDDNSGKSRRGALGFRAGVFLPASLFQVFIEPGVRYSGMLWPGSGGYDDRFEFVLQLTLFKWRGFNKSHHLTSQ